MSELFIPSKMISINDNIEVKDRLLSAKNENNNLRGHVFTFHEDKLTGKKTLLDDDHNHIVLTGRKWLLQRAVGFDFDDTQGQCGHVINWFGVGSGGAKSGDPLIPLDTPDQTIQLSNPIKMYKYPYTGYTYADSGFKKSFKKVNGQNAEIKFDAASSEVLALFQCVLDYEDCPYDMPELGCTVNELGLYISQTQTPTAINFTLFSRYCRPSIYKSVTDRYTFLWYVYF